MTHLRHIPLGYGGEFSVITAALERWGDLASGIGDDCAVLDVPAGRRLVLSVDTSVDGVHFRRRWLTPEEIGYRATTAALSDLAAMAAQPMGVAIAMTLPDAWRGDYLKICDGIGQAVRAADAHIIGGDLTRGAELSLTLTVVGHVGTPLSRSGAQPGNALWVTGQLGGPALALRAWNQGGTPDTESRARFAHPVARCSAAQWLAAHGATAGIDLSDGLVSDAGHLAAAGNVQLIVNLDRVPKVAGASFEEAASSGEEYELLVSAPASLDASAFTAACGVAITCIGAIVPALPGAPEVETLCRGAHMDVARGNDHFPAP